MPINGVSSSTFNQSSPVQQQLQTQQLQQAKQASVDKDHDGDSDTGQLFDVKV